jgi:phage antirepressor YoqD-like protein
MNEMTLFNEKTMTVKEVAEALGVSVDTILNSIKDLEAQSEKIRFGKIQGEHGGKPYYVLNEAQVTAVKMNLRKNSRVAAQPKTALERNMVVLEAINILREDNETLRKENETLREENAEMRPKAEVYDGIVERGKAMCLRDTAAEIGMRQTDFIDYLLERGYIYRKGGEFRFYAEYGRYFVEREIARNGHDGLQGIGYAGRTRSFRAAFRQERDYESGGVMKRKEAAKSGAAKGSRMAR